MRVVHASGYIMCTDGPRQLYTLCGLYQPNGKHAQSADEVTCKTCRRARSWAAMLESLVLAAAPKIDISNGVRCGGRRKCPEAAA